jgi:hypothetical protein
LYQWYFSMIVLNRLQTLRSERRIVNTSRSSRLRQVSSMSNVMRDWEPFSLDSRCFFLLRIVFHKNMCFLNSNIAFLEFLPLKAWYFFVHFMLSIRSEVSLCFISFFFGKNQFDCIYILPRRSNMCNGLIFFCQTKSIAKYRNRYHI